MRAMRSIELDGIGTEAVSALEGVPAPTAEAAAKIVTMTQWAVRRRRTIRLAERGAVSEAKMITQERHGSRFLNAQSDSIRRGEALHPDCRLPRALFRAYCVTPGADADGFGAATCIMPGGMTPDV